MRTIGPPKAGAELIQQKGIGRSPIEGGTRIEGIVAIVTRKRRHEKRCVPDGETTATCPPRSPVLLSAPKFCECTWNWSMESRGIFSRIYSRCSWLYTARSIDSIQGQIVVVQPVPGKANGPLISRAVIDRARGERG